MPLEEFFDLRIATLEPGESAPRDADLLRIGEPSPMQVARGIQEGWYHKPNWITWMIGVPGSIDAYIAEVFRSRLRSKPRALLRDVPRRYRVLSWPVEDHFDAFYDLYRATIVSRPRGKDRIAEHGGRWGRPWSGLSVHDGDSMVAGVLVHEEPGHLSIGYGAFDPVHARATDLEHFLIMKVLERAIQRGDPAMSLGMDTNRYGHHLPLGLPAYKRRIGFTPLAYDPGGWELLKIQKFDRFERGLFFYARGDRGLEGHFFTRGTPDFMPAGSGSAVRIHRI